MITLSFLTKTLAFCAFPLYNLYYKLIKNKKAKQL